MTPTSRRGALYATAAVAISVWAWQGAGVDFSELAGGTDGAADLATSFLRPDLTPTFLLDVGLAAAETVQIAVVGLLLALALGGPLASLLAGNVGANPAIRITVRLATAVLRGVPDLVWALILVAAIGPGPAAGSIAIALHGIGMLAKLGAEQLETVNPAPVEAVRLSGASRAATAALAVLPQSRSGLASVTLYQFECNIRTSTVLGFVGAGASVRRWRSRCDSSGMPSCRPTCWRCWCWYCWSTPDRAGFAGDSGRRSENVREPVRITWQR